MKKILFALAALSFSSVGETSTQDSIKGLWVLEQDHTIIEMSINNDLVEGKIYSRPGNRIDSPACHGDRPPGQRLVDLSAIMSAHTRPRLDVLLCVPAS